jgi:hypothetical protein
MQPSVTTTTITTTQTATEETPKRQSPRVAVQSDSRIGVGDKKPISISVVLNISDGGVLMFTHSKHQEGASIQIELSEPIFPVARLVRGRIAHIAAVPEDLLAALRDKGKADKKQEGYLLGIEFISMDDDTRKTLDRFIHQRLQQEKKRRTEENGEDKQHTARERKMRLKKAQVPAWAFMLGFLVGSYEVVSGILNNLDDTTIIWHAGLALLTFYAVGRIAVAVWTQLDAGRDTEATIIARLDHPVSDVEEALADADTEIDLSAAETPNEAEAAPVEFIPDETERSEAIFASAA